MRIVNLSSFALMLQRGSRNLNLHRVADRQIVTLQSVRHSYHQQFDHRGGGEKPDGHMEPFQSEAMYAATMPFYSMLPSKMIALRGQNLGRYWHGCSSLHGFRHPFQGPVASAACATAAICYATLSWCRRWTSMCFLFCRTARLLRTFDIGRVAR